MSEDVLCVMSSGTGLGYTNPFQKLWKNILQKSGFLEKHDSFVWVLTPQNFHQLVAYPLPSYLFKKRRVFGDLFFCSLFNKKFQLRCKTYRPQKSQCILFK